MSQNVNNDNLIEQDKFIENYLKHIESSKIKQQIITNKLNEINEKFNKKINKIRNDHDKNIEQINNKIEIENDNIKLNETIKNNTNNEQHKEVINALNIKYKEYIFCQYENGIIGDNTDIYMNDNLIKMYNAIIDNTNNNNFDNILDTCNKLMEEIDNVIENEILIIKKKKKFTAHDWEIIVSHKYNNKYDYSQTKFINTSLKVDIICYIHGIYSLLANNHLKGFGCPKCRQETRAKELQILALKNSFHHHEKSKFWSPKNLLKPNDVSIHSTELFIFDCSCGHEFSIRLFCIKDGQWCPYCGNHKLCKNNCDSCFSKSFASSPKVLLWSDKNTVNPRDIFLKTSKTKYLFNCGNCCHEINKSPGSIYDGTWCPYCANHKLCNDINCKDCNEKSFVSHPMAKYWSKKNKLKPHMIVKSSMEKIIFDCPKCGEEYISKPIYVRDGHWCNCKTNKTEAILYEFLQKIYPHLIIEREKKFDFCINVKRLPFDFCIEQYKIIIELDGSQHFMANSYFKSKPEEIQKTDKYKMIQAKNNGYSIIRIQQKNVLLNRNNWEQNLKDAIIKTSQSIGNPIIIYIGKLYETHYFTLD